MASNAVLPAAASPPVSAMPKPIVIGSAARAAAPARTHTANAVAAAEKWRNRCCCWVSSIIAPSLASARRAPLTDRPDAALIRSRAIEHNRGETSHAAPADMRRHARGHTRRGLAPMFSFDLAINAVVAGLLLGGFYAAVT